MDIDKNLLAALTFCTRLYRTPGLRHMSASSWHKMIGRFAEKGIKNPGEVLDMNETDLVSLGFDKTFASRVAALNPTSGRVQIIAEKLCDKGIDILPIDDDRYPDKIVSRLQTAAPPVLFCAGNTELLNMDGIAAVGSRKPEESAKKFASSLGRAAAKEGYVLISGGANGCDCIAEHSATSHGGSAVLYLAVPLMRRMNEPRVSRLIKEGRICLASDHSPIDDFTAGYAIDRNRYIYSAANCAAVCASAAERGGSYNGALSAIIGGYGTVACFNDEKCYGNQMLILKGAASVNTVEDVIDIARKA